MSELFQAIRDVRSNLSFGGWSKFQIDQMILNQIETGSALENLLGKKNPNANVGQLLGSIKCSPSDLKRSGVLKSGYGFSDMIEDFNALLGAVGLWICAVPTSEGDIQNIELYRK